MIESLSMKLSAVNPKIAVIIAALGTGGLGVGSYVESVGEHIIKVERLDINVGEVKKDIVKIEHSINKIENKVDGIYKILLEMKSK